MLNLKNTARLAVTAGLCASMVMGGAPVSAIAEELQADAASVEVTGSVAPGNTEGVATANAPTVEDESANATSDKSAVPAVAANDLSADSTDSTEAETPGYVEDENGNVEISTADGLAHLAEVVNKGTNFQGKTVKLTADINLANQEWTPIGKSGATFNGTFDGQGHIISNLKISGGINTSAANSDKGLFGFTSNGELKNFTVHNANVTGGLDVGAIAGTPYTSKMTDLKLTGDVHVEGFSYVGGMFGKNLYKGVSNLTIDANEGSKVVANSGAYRTYVGGLVGFMGEGDITVSNVISNISVEGSTCDVGGLTGIAHYGNKFVNCSVVAPATVTVTAADPENLQEIGGLAGVWMNSNAGNVTFEDCSFGGTLSATDNTGKDYTQDIQGNSLSGGVYNAFDGGDAGGQLNIVEDDKTTVVPGSTKALQEALKNPVDGQTIKLAGDVTCDVVIPKGVTVTIDLAGHAITNDKGHTITNNGTLAIKDTVGGGVVDAVTPGSIAFVNNGTATIENGKLTRSKESGTPGAQGANTNYTVNNKGKLTVKGGEIVNTSTGSSLIRNGQNSTLNIEGGRFSNVFNTVKNEETGELKISGGVIESEDQAVQNWGVADISGGEFSGSVMAWGWEDFESSLTIGGDAVVNGDVVAVKYKDYESNPGITINGGTVNGEVFKATSDGSAPAEKVDSSHKGSDIVVNGGIFSDPSAGDFLAPDAGLQQDENGNFKPVEVALVLDDAVVEGTYTFDIKGGTAEPLTEDDLLGLVSVNAIGYTVSVDTTNLDALNEAIESVDISESFDFVYTATKDEVSAARSGDLTTTVTISLVDTGDPTVKPEPVDKGALSQLVSDAKQVSTEGKSEKVVAEFKAALAEAIAVFEDEDATQDEIDAAFARLSAALTALDADKGEGQKPGDKPGSGDEQKPAKPGDKGDTLPTTDDNSMLPIAVAGVAGAAAVAAGVAVTVKRRKQQ